MFSLRWASVRTPYPSKDTTFKRPSDAFSNIKFQPYCISSLTAPMDKSSYSRFEQLLHQLALGSDIVRELSFDLQSFFSKKTPEDLTDRQHVFISGLARAGTSILLRTLHRQDSFATLTYRDMPFVMAPGLWKRISRNSQFEGVARERAHADGLEVDFDSPEAFEEVFWLTFFRTDYVRDTHLIRHSVSSEMIDLFRRFVLHVISAKGNQHNRYLSKNNNNLLRLESIREAFPACVLVIPFRRPYDHASSLLRQHLRFIEIQSHDSFASKYMSWLGHYEFGVDHRPFFLLHEQNAKFANSPESVNYWLENWAHVYKSVLDRYSDDAYFLDYDAFCKSPPRTLRSLAERVGLDSIELTKLAGTISKPKPYDLDKRLDEKIMKHAEEIHMQLSSQAKDKGQ